MPVRPRGNGWQVDVFVAGCKRVRHQVNGTKRQAETIEHEIRVALLRHGAWDPTAKPVVQAVEATETAEDASEDEIILEALRILQRRVAALEADRRRLLGRLRGGNGLADDAHCDGRSNVFGCD